MKASIMLPKYNGDFNLKKKKKKLEKNLHFQKSKDKSV